MTDYSDLTDVQLRGLFDFVSSACHRAEQQLRSAEGALQIVRDHKDEVMTEMARRGVKPNERNEP